MLNCTEREDEGSTNRKQKNVVALKHAKHVTSA